jgi:hypothetical protein
MNVTVQTKPLLTRYTLVLLCDDRQFVAPYTELNNLKQTRQGERQVQKVIAHGTGWQGKPIEILAEMSPDGWAGARAGA